MLASWPGVIAPGSVYNDLVDFSDITPTCLALAGVPEPSGLDGISFAPQLQGLPGTPRTWIHVLQLTRYFARDLHWKLRENGSLYDVSDSPYEETRITNNTLTPEAEAARTRLQAVLDQLHPNGSQKQHQKKERSKDAAE
jgi:arylsulfatase A-like enzyme